MRDLVAIFRDYLFSKLGNLLYFTFKYCSAIAAGKFGKPLPIGTISVWTLGLIMKLVYKHVYVCEQL